jgi:hypothetical protein
MKRILVFIFLFSFITNFYGQDLEKHQWKNRVLLIVSSKEKNKAVLKQVQILKKENKGLQEQKLVFYTIFKEYYKYNFQLDKQKSQQQYHQFNKDDSPFKIFLIGLDGSIKLKQEALLSANKLFTIIDGMPMRRSEMKRQ